MEDTIKWKVRLQLGKARKGFYLIAMMKEIIDGRFVERPDLEKCLKLSCKNDDDTEERLVRIMNKHCGEITDMFFNGRLYKAKKIF